MAQALQLETAVFVPRLAPQFSLLNFRQYLLDLALQACDIGGGCSLNFVLAAIHGLDGDGDSSSRLLDHQKYRQKRLI